MTLCKRFTVIVALFFALSSLFSLGLPGKAFGFPQEFKSPPVILQKGGRFFQVDIDRNGQPDQLGFQIKSLVRQAGEVWLSGELQTLIAGTWYTIDYTALPFEWSEGEQTGTLYFYGGELRRLKTDGPFRILVGVREGAWEADNQIVDFSAKFPWEEWQASDQAVTDGPVTRASEAEKLAREWAKKRDQELGSLTEKTFVFARWRMDFSGTPEEPPRRLWVDPSGEIFSAEE